MAKSGTCMPYGNTYSCSTKVMLFPDSAFQMNAFIENYTTNTK